MIPNDHLWNFKLKTQESPLTLVVIHIHQSLESHSPAEAFGFCLYI